MSKNPKVFLEDILRCCEKIEKLCSGLTQEQFELNEEKQAAVMYYLQIIGEATKRLHSADPTVGERTPHIPWIDMAKTRDFLIHHYEEAKVSEIWQTIQNDIPSLLSQIKSLLVKFQ